MSTSAAQAAAFYDEAIAGQAVWSMQDAGGIPAPQRGDDRRAMPFWSKRSRCQRVIDTVAAYAGFEPIEIPLAEFEERWLAGLASDGLLVGLNWSGTSATGYDVTSDDVAAGLAARRR